MAEKRMFSNKITQSDPFLDMPASAQNLYFHLNMDADDEGFVNRTKSIMRMIGAREDDLKLLIAKHFIIPFEVESKDGVVNVVVVIKHWFIHNKIRNDRMKYTNYTQQRNMLAQSENGAYTLLNSGFAQDDNQVSTKCRHRVVENRVVESSIDKDVHLHSNDDNLQNKLFDIFWLKFPVKKNKQRAKEIFNSIITTQETLDVIIADIEKRLKTVQWENIQFIPHPSTYLKDKRWLDEYSSEIGNNDSSKGIRSSAVQPVYENDYSLASKDEIDNMKRSIEKEITNGK